MPKRRTFGGKTYTFPDDATEDEMIAAVEADAKPEGKRVHGRGDIDRNDAENPQQPSAARRFAGAALETINPMNAIRALPALIPYTDANLEATAARLRRQTDNPLGAALESSPLGQFGGVHAGERAGAGDIAGGLGELAGEVAQVIPPTAVAKAARPLLRGAGHIVEAVASPTKTLHRTADWLKQKGSAGIPQSAQVAGIEAGVPRSVRMAPPGEGSLASVLDPESAAVIERMNSSAAAPEVLPATGRGPGIDPETAAAVERLTDPQESIRMSPPEPRGPLAGAIDPETAATVDRMQNPAAAPELLPATGRGPGLDPDTAAAIERMSASAPDEIDLTAASGGAPNVAVERAAERFGRRFVDEGATTPEGSRTPAAVLEAAEEVPELPAAVDVEAPVEAPAVRPSKSKDTSAVPGLSQNDLKRFRELIRENPDMPDEVIWQIIEEERAGRQSGHILDYYAGKAAERDL